MRLRVLFEEHEGMNFSAQEDYQDNNGKWQYINGDRLNNIKKLYEREDDEEDDDDESDDE
jgi:hypothetical protein